MHASFHAQRVDNFYIVAVLKNAKATVLIIQHSIVPERQTITQVPQETIFRENKLLLKMTTCFWMLVEVFKSALSDT